MQHIHLPIQLPQFRSRVKHIPRQKPGFEAVLVAEQRVAKVPELGAKVRAVEVLARAAVGDKLSDLGAETAAEVEEGVLVVFEAREDGGVEGGGAEVEADEEEDAYAWVGEPGGWLVRCS
jgi:hypothetical protein